VPHEANWLQLPPHPERSQNATFCDAQRHFVFGALRHAGPPEYVVQAPPQTLSAREEQ
jgi:hypothetical protein